jgi:hypothetical protein
MFLLEKALSYVFLVAWLPCLEKIQPEKFDERMSDMAGGPTRTLP